MTNRSRSALPKPNNALSENGNQMGIDQRRSSAFTSTRLSGPAVSHIPPKSFPEDHSTEERRSEDRQSEPRNRGLAAPAEQCR
jgi:hypothetical protein